MTMISQRMLRRLRLFYERNLTLEEIADLQYTSIHAVKDTIKKHIGWAIVQYGQEHVNKMRPRYERDSYSVRANERGIQDTAR